MPFPRRRAVLAVAAVLGAAPIAKPAAAQDTFEIQVYEYATVPRGMWNLETHANYTTRGTTVFAGRVAPTQHQTHLTFELTRGITDYVELAGYLVLAHREGAGAEYVGYRIRPRVRAPETWGLPVDLSFSAEVGFPSAAYEEASTTLELRPIIEKRFGRVLVDANPVLGRSLRGPGSGAGWDFEPGVRVGYAWSPMLEFSVEYYGSTGVLTDPLPLRDQVHQFFPGVDINFNPNVVLNVGVGFAATDGGNQRVLKSRLGWMFGGKQ